MSHGWWVMHMCLMVLEAHGSHGYTFRVPSGHGYMSSGQWVTDMSDGPSGPWIVV